MVDDLTDCASEHRKLRREWMSTYRACCREYQISPCPDVLACFRLGSPDLELHSWRHAMPFGELDLQPLLDTFDACPEAFSQLRSMTLTNACLGPSSTALLASHLSRPHCRVEAFSYKKNWPRVTGVEALLGAARARRGLSTLDLSRCSLHDEGVVPLISLLQEGRDAHGLKKLSLRRNGLSFEAVTQLKEACGSSSVKLDLRGNYILHEVLNALSCGLGVILAIVGTVFMSYEVTDKPASYVLSVTVYSTAFLFLNLCSTLYHSFTMLPQQVLHIFGILEHGGIFLHIAGSFCPFICIHLPRHSWIVVVHFCAAIGGLVVMFNDGPYKDKILVALFCVLGWSCLAFVPDLMEKVGDEGTFLMVLGGVLYSMGVPFFVRQKRTLGLPDHTIWHLFVLAGSLSHYFCILWYCLRKDPECPGGECIVTQ